MLTQFSMNAIFREDLESFDGLIGASLISHAGDELLSLNSLEKFPMQSMYKFHIALVVLHLIDCGKLNLNEVVKLEPQELSSKLWAPILRDYPHITSFKLEVLIDYAVSKSDNVACDALVRMAEGIESVNSFFKSNYHDDISIIYNEADQQADWHRQYENWTTPSAMTSLMRDFYQGRIVSPDSIRILFHMMCSTKTGSHRLKFLLPPEAIIAHKTGTSGVNEFGLRGAVNDAGIIIGVKNHEYYLCVCIKDTRAPLSESERIISLISKYCLDFL